MIKKILKKFYVFTLASLLFSLSVFATNVFAVEEESEASGKNFSDVKVSTTESNEYWLSAKTVDKTKDVFVQWESKKGGRKARIPKSWIQEDGSFYLKLSDGVVDGRSVTLIQGEKQEVAVEKFDSTPPAPATFTEETNDKVSGTMESGAKVILNYKGIDDQWHTLRDDQVQLTDTTFTAELNPRIQDGFRLSVVVLDKMGNRSEKAFTKYLTDTEGSQKAAKALEETLKLWDQQKRTEFDSDEHWNAFEEARTKAHELLEKSKTTYVPREELIPAREAIFEAYKPLEADREAGEKQEVLNELRSKIELAEAKTKDTKYTRATREELKEAVEYAKATADLKEVTLKELKVAIAHLDETVLRLEVVETAVGEPLFIEDEKKPVENKVENKVTTVKKAPAKKVLPSTGVENSGLVLGGLLSMSGSVLSLYLKRRSK